MYQFNKLLTIFTVLISVASALPTAPTLPSSDDFYDAPSGYESAAEGEILKWRDSPNSYGPALLPLNISGAWQALVRSTDSFGNPNAIVTTILKPHNPDTKKVLSYQVAEDSASLDCSPSYALLHNSNPDTLNGQVEIIAIQAALNEGWYIVTPDYEGPKSAFTAGRQAGHAVLDSLRATIKSANQTGLSSEAKFALFGYSGGSLARYVQFLFLFFFSHFYFLMFSYTN